MTDQPPPLSHIFVTDNVLQQCWAHAFSSEKEEILGVLFGSIDPAEVTDASVEKATPKPSGPSIARVWGSMVLPRSVKAADRVEVSPEALIAASDRAEEMKRESGRPTQVIGWYHSHPKITPYPSAVDLRSQWTYQQMEPGWVGLIFSVFNADKREERGDCSVHAFQAISPDGTVANLQHAKIPLEVISRHNLGEGLDKITIDGTYDVLQQLHSEVHLGASQLEARFKRHPGVVKATEGMLHVQESVLDFVAGEPGLEYYHASSIPVLEAEVKRLEAELAAATLAKKKPQEQPTQQTERPRRRKSQPSA